MGTKTPDNEIIYESTEPIAQTRLKAHDTRERKNKRRKIRDLIVQTKVIRALSVDDDKQYEREALEELTKINSIKDEQEEGLDISVPITPAEENKSDKSSDKKNTQKTGKIIRNSWKKIGSIFKRMSGNKQGDSNLPTTLTGQTRCSADEFSIDNPLVSGAQNSKNIKATLVKPGQEVASENDNSTPRGPQM